MSGLPRIQWFQWSVSLCSVFNLHENVNMLIVHELSGFTCTCSQTINSKFSIPHEALLHTPPN